jgi:two-component system, OmpR family, aerobic respiration control sensor histidine kinase ArcB
MVLSNMQSQIRVLVVEDHPIAQKIARLVLEGLSCYADIAGSSKEALELFVQHSYDLIFMDIGLPDMDGLHTTACIRSEEDKSNFSSVPIVGLTAHTDEQLRLEVLEAGMNDLIAKPLAKENCTEILNRFCQFSDQKGQPIKKTVFNDKFS